MRLINLSSRNAMPLALACVFASLLGLASCGGGGSASTANTDVGGSTPASVASDAASSAAAAVIAARTALTAGSGKLKIFVLAGQSNMQGFGRVETGVDPVSLTGAANVLGGSGTLRAMVNNKPAAYSYLVEPVKTATYTVNGITKTFPAWVVRKDVWISNWGGALGSATESNSGALTVGFGSENTMPDGYIGPEFGFGHIVGNAMGDKVLLIKTSWGGKSLAVDFRPPSSGGTVGPYYSEIIAKVRMVLADVKKYYPAYDGNGVELAGFGWHQGYNDRITTAYVAQYEVNLANLIRDVRKDLGVPTMPFVIANTGMANADGDAQALRLIAAQGNVSDPKKYPEFAGSVTTVDTRPFYYPLTSPTTIFGHHWNYNGESYFHIGEYMGNAMVKLIAP